LVPARYSEGSSFRKSIVQIRATVKVKVKVVNLYSASSQTRL